MVNKPLTTAAKLEILEKAINMGAHIDINFHMKQLKTKVAVSEVCQLFSDMNETEHTMEGTNWYNFQNDSQFEGTVFLPDYYPLPIGWADAGDVEEDE